MKRSGRYPKPIVHDYVNIWKPTERRSATFDEKPKIAYWYIHASDCRCRKSAPAVTLAAAKGIQ